MKKVCFTLSIINIFWNLQSFKIVLYLLLRWNEMEISESPAVDGDKQRHAQLAGVVKGLHAKLRQRFRNCK